MPLAIAKTLEVVKVSFQLCKAKVKGQKMVFGGSCTQRAFISQNFSALGGMHTGPFISPYLAVTFGLLGAGTE